MHYACTEDIPETPFICLFFLFFVDLYKTRDDTLRLTCSLATPTLLRSRYIAKSQQKNPMTLSLDGERALPSVLCDPRHSPSSFSPAVGVVVARDSPIAGK